MELTVLGCDGSWPGAGGAGSGYLVSHDGINLVLDLGGGALGVLQEHIAIADIDAIFISHVHPDHFADLYPLTVACFYGGLGEDRLPLYAPPGFFEPATAILVEGTREAWDGVFDTHEMRSGETAEFGSLSVRAFGMSHTGVSLGFRVESPVGALAYSGDAGPDDSVAELASGADVFLCEATRQDGGERTFHLTARQAGGYAAAAGVGGLVLTHLEPVLDKAKSAAQAAEAFGGEVALASPGLVVTIDARQGV